MRRTVSRRSGHGPALALMVGVVVLWLAVLAVSAGCRARANYAGKVFVAFPARHGAGRGFSAIVSAGGAPGRPALGDWAWIAHADAAGFVGRLTGRGALAAFCGAPTRLSLAGCFGLAADPEVPYGPFARALAVPAAAFGS